MAGRQDAKKIEIQFQPEIRMFSICEFSISIRENSFGKKWQEWFILLLQNPLF
jgi:hypothetical protein